MLILKKISGRKRMVLGDNALTDITLKELYEEHLAHCEVRRLSEHTVNTYKKNYRLLEQCLGSDYIVSKTNDSTIQQYINFLCNTYSSKDTTLNSRLKYVRTLFYFAIERGYCKSFKIHLLKCNQENKTPLTKDEVQKLIAKPKKETFAEVRMWTITNLVLATGIRSRNVREAKVNDLDISNRTLYLRDTKAHKPQTIYLSQNITNILVDWLKLTGFKGEVPLFPTVYGEEMSLHVLKRAFMDYAEKRGVKTSLHILRHTYARDLVKADVNPIIIKELLGHQSLEVTQRYIKLFSDEIQKATDGLDTLAQYQKNRIKLGGSK